MIEKENTGTEILNLQMTPRSEKFDNLYDPSVDELLADWFDTTLIPKCFYIGVDIGRRRKFQKISKLKISFLELTISFTSS